MASLACSDDQFDWLWGSLRPWQILHSTLAARERNGSTRLDDVWELVNEALTTGASTENHSLRREIYDDRDAQGSGSTKWALGMRLLAHHDGEFWRQGGVIESQVREWLLSSRSSDCDDQQIMPACLPSSPPASNQNQNLHCYQSASSTLHKLTTTGGGDRQLQVVQYQYAAAGAGTVCGDGGGSVQESRAVESRCCAGGAGDDESRFCAGGGGDNGSRFSLGGGGDDGAVAAEVCAVCLEKLEEEEEEEEEAVQMLTCQHLFHEACIAPWLARQPHARCPCCRAPITAPPHQLRSAAPLHFFLEPPPPPPPPPPPRSADSHHEPRDIMGLLSDVEAALERLGFRE